MLKNDTLKNGTSRIDLYGSAPPPGHSQQANRLNYRSSRPGKLEYRYRCRFIIYVLFQTAFNCLKMIFENMLFAFRTCNGLNINNGMKKKHKKLTKFL